MTATLFVSTGPSPVPAVDSLKDLDALAFLRHQPADVRSVWLERCRLLRFVDDLAERDRWDLSRFIELWRRDEYLGRMPEDARHADTIRAIWRSWFRDATHMDRDRAGYSWSCWLDALSADYGRATVPATLEQHDAMVSDVGGFFRLFPYLTPEQWESIAAFGALDQAWNNVRDLAEDGAADRCFLPVEVLGRFRLNKFSVTGGTARRLGCWRDFMSFWLGTHLPTLADRARPFLEATDLHPSLEALRYSCLLRYGRVERVLRGLEFDYRAFPEAYWAEVRLELGAQARGGDVKEIA